MTKEKKEMLSKILDHIFTDGFTNDHENNDQVYIPDVILLQIRENGIDLCAAAPKAAYFCINPFWMEGDIIHLMQGSVGGVVDLRHVEDLNAAVAEYNRYHFDKLYTVRPNHASMKKARERITAALA